MVGNQVRMVMLIALPYLRFLRFMTFQYFRTAIVYGRNNGINGIKMSLWQGKTAKDIDGKVVQLEAIAKKVTLVTNGMRRLFLSVEYLC
jgi:hypothetical protein